MRSGWPVTLNHVKRARLETALGRPKNAWYCSLVRRNELLMTNTNGSSVIAEMVIRTEWIGRSDVRFS
jgi:hypothetical protein